MNHTVELLSLYIGMILGQHLVVADPKYPT
jgi:hypothetical protein